MIKHMICCKYMSVCVTLVDLGVEVGMCVHVRMRINLLVSVNISAHQRSRFHFSVGNKVGCIWC